MAAAAAVVVAVVRPAPQALLVKVTQAEMAKLADKTMVVAVVVALDLLVQMELHYLAEMAALGLHLQSLDLQ